MHKCVLKSCEWSCGGYCCMPVCYKGLDSANEKMKLVEEIDRCIERMKRVANRTHQVDTKDDGTVNGVYRDGKKYRVQIQRRNKTYYIGEYKDFEKAVEMRTEAEKMLKKGVLDEWEYKLRQEREAAKKGK